MSKRATKQGQQYKKNRKAPVQQQKKQEGLSTSSKVVITVFAVLMALSMMIPSLAGIFGKTDQTTAPASIEELDSRYSEVTEPLEKKLASNPDDMDTTLSLAETYMSWGYNVSYMATVDAETSHANELFAKAMSLFDAYIAANPDTSGQAKVDRALCLLYSGDTGNALSAMKTITEEDPENAIAWANLGLLYEINGDSDSARTAYEAAIEHDPDNAQGAKTYASSRLLSLNNNGNTDSLPTALRDLSGTGV